MAVILLSKSSKRPVCKLSGIDIAAWLIVFSVLLSSVALLAGFQLRGMLQQSDDGITELIQTELELRQAEVEEAKHFAQENINALTLRLAELQSRVIRLDAMGQRLTEMANLDEGEFDFQNPPALGGVASPDQLEEAALSDFLASFDRLAEQLGDREEQLLVLESLLMSRSLEDEVYPAGLPAEKGWISSYFGKRTDPFTGRPAYHQGVDIAGKSGTHVLAVAAGVVTWSDDRYGYGTMVEINHGDGYTTRYAHNKKNLVEPGDVSDPRLGLLGDHRQLLIVTRFLAAIILAVDGLGVSDPGARASRVVAR